MVGTDSEGDDASGLLAAIWEGNFYVVDYLLKLPSIDVSTAINRSNVLHYALETQNTVHGIKRTFKLPPHIKRRK